MGEALFRTVMDAGLRDWLASLAGERAKAKAEQSRRATQAAFGAAALGVIGFLFMQDVIGAAFLAFGAFGVAWAWASAPVRAVSTDIKVRANEGLAAAMGLAYTLDKGASPDFYHAQSLGLIPSDPDEATYDDYWESAEGDVRALTLHQAHLQEWRQSGRNRQLVTVFRGVIMAYRHARDFHATTIVRRDAGVLNAWVGMAAALSGRRMERVAMVDPRFEKAFEVLGEDQVEARYLVHPAFCERLLTLEEAFSGKNLRLAFTAGRVVVVMETGDLFESGGIDAAGDEARLRATIDQIGALIELSTTLNERERA